MAQAGQYEVYAQWTRHANRATDATYTVTHAGGSTPVAVNQQANGYVIADAIRLVPVAIQAEPKLHFVHADHLNTPRLVADATGTTVWRWDQAEPFGNNPADEDPDANSIAFDPPLRLPGQYNDKETGLA